MNKKRIIIIVLSLIVISTLIFNLLPHKELDLKTVKKGQEGIEEIIDWYFEEYSIPALNVAIIKDGKIKSIINKGEIERNSKKPTSKNTIYQVASLTKTFSGIIAKSASIDGVVDLNENISSFFPNSPLSNKLKNITINDLIHHTSGLPVKANSLKRKLFGGAVSQKYTEQDLFKDLRESDFLFKPGTSWAYSNLGYATLGFILEQKTGLKYSELVTKYISNKYKLNNTKINLPNNERLLLATPYRPEWNSIKTSDSEFGLHAAASGMYTNISDLSKLMLLQLKAYKNFDSLKTKSPLVLNDKKVGLGEMRYGRGIFENLLIKEKDTITYLSHGGDFDGYASHYGFIPKENIGIILLTSSGGDWFWKMEKQLINKLLEEK